MRKAASPPFMTLEEIVEYARISKRTFYRLLRQGLISVHRIGPDVRFCKDEVDQLIAKRKKKDSPVAHILRRQDILDKLATELPRHTIYKLLGQGGIPFLKVGSEYRFDKDENRQVDGSAASKS